MPDDELGGGHDELVREALEMDALMGWDGNPCGCQECDCPRFRDGAPDALCADCRAGHHAAFASR